MKCVQLYEIKDILLKDEHLFIACQERLVKGYIEHFASFEVGQPHSIFRVINADDFDGPPIHLYCIGNKYYIRLKKYFI